MPAVRMFGVPAANRDRGELSNYLDLSQEHRRVRIARVGPRVRGRDEAGEIA